MTKLDAPTSITWRVCLPANPDRVLTAWLDPADQEGFLCRTSELAPGGFHLTFPNGEATRLSVRQIVSPSRLIFSYFDAVVDITLQPRGHETELTLVTTGYAPSACLDVTAGWVSVLWALKALLTTGRDLRTHHPSHTWNERYVDQ
jgi:hypothetical protein